VGIRKSQSLDGDRTSQPHVDGGIDSVPLYNGGEGGTEGSERYNGSLSDADATTKEGRVGGGNDAYQSEEDITTDDDGGGGDGIDDRPGDRDITTLAKGRVGADAAAIGGGRAGVHEDGPESAITVVSNGSEVESHREADITATTGAATNSTANKHSIEGSSHGANIPANDRGTGGHHRDGNIPVNDGNNDNNDSNNNNDDGSEVHYLDVCPAPSQTAGDDVFWPEPLRFGLGNTGDRGRVKSNLGRQLPSQLSSSGYSSSYSPARFPTGRTGSSERLLRSPSGSMRSIEVAEPPPTSLNYTFKVLRVLSLVYALTKAGFDAVNTVGELSCFFTSRLCLGWYLGC
jgi:hypothetical protein